MRIFTDAFLSEFKPLSVIIIKYGKHGRHGISETNEGNASTKKGKEAEKKMGKAGKRDNSKRKHNVCSRPIKNAHKTPKKGSQGKETGKTTIHKVSNFKIRPSLLTVHKGKGQTVRIVRHNYEFDLRTPDKKRKEKRKVG